MALIATEMADPQHAFPRDEPVPIFEGSSQKN
jgi:hypothetical protein